MEGHLLYLNYVNWILIWVAGMMVLLQNHHLGKLPQKVDWYGLGQTVDIRLTTFGGPGLSVFNS